MNDGSLRFGEERKRRFTVKTISGWLCLKNDCSDNEKMNREKLFNFKDCHNIRSKETRLCFMLNHVVYFDYD